MPPQQVKVIRAENDSTVLVVSWQPLTIVEARSFILYVVVVRPTKAKKRQSAELRKEVAMNESSVRFEGLDPFVGYDVTVGTLTINSRQSGPGECIYTVGRSCSGDYDLYKVFLHILGFLKHCDHVTNAQIYF